MDKRFRRIFQLRVTSIYLLALVYFLVLSGLLALLFVEEQRGAHPFSLSHAAITENDAATDTLVFQGEGLHEGLHSLSVAALLDEDMEQWEMFPGTTIRVLAVEGDTALVVAYLNKLIRLDLSVFSSPRLVDSLDLPRPVNDVKIHGDRAVIGMSNDGGIAIVDIGHPEQMVLAGHFPLPGNIVKMATGREQVYCVDSQYGLRKVDLKKETPVPEEVMSMDHPLRLAYSEGKLAVADTAGGLHLFDVLQDGTPLRQALLNFPDSKMGRIRGVAFSGGALAVALSEGDLRIYGMSSWPAIKETSSLTLPGVPYEVVATPQLGSLAISFVSGGLVLVDVAQGKAALSGYLPLPTTPLALGFDEAMAYLSGYGDFSGLKAFPLDSVMENDMPLGGTFSRQDYVFHSWDGQLYGYQKDLSLDNLHVRGTTMNTSTGNILLAGDKWGVSVFERMADGQIVRTGSLLSTDKVEGAFYMDAHLYLLDRDELRVFAGPSLEEMTLVKTSDIPGNATHMRRLDDDHLLVATVNEGLLVVEVKDRDHPFICASFKPPSHLHSTALARDVLMDGHRAYVTFGTGGVYVVDFKMPEAPQLLQIIETPGKARQMVLYERLLLVADGDRGIYMIDVADRDHVVPIGSLPTPVIAKEIAITADGILVSSYPGGSMKIPLPQRVRNVQVANDGEARGEVADAELGSYVYLYDDSVSQRVLVGAPRGN